MKAVFTMVDKHTIIVGLIFALLLYVVMAWGVFEWRHPLCNDAAFFRHFGSVLRFERLEQYQERDGR